MVWFWKHFRRDRISLDSQCIQRSYDSFCHTVSQFKQNRFQFNRVNFVYCIQDFLYRYLKRLKITDVIFQTNTNTLIRWFHLGHIFIQKKKHILIFHNNIVFLHNVLTYNPISYKTHRNLLPLFIHTVPRCGSILPTLFLHNLYIYN